MKRRAFMAALGGAAAWPLVARAQTSMPVIGVISGGTVSPPFSAFWQGLSEVGFVEKQNISIIHRWAEGRYQELPALAADLVKQQVAVIVAVGSIQSALAAKAVTSSIPIVFANGSDPLAFGLVASLNRPGGNITGISFFTATLEGKRLGLLHELVPGAAALAFQINPANPNAAAQLKDVQQAAQTLGRRVDIFEASNERDFEPTFAKMANQRVGGVLVGSDPYVFGLRRQVVALAARFGLPAIYEWREFVEAGGLASYGTKLADAYRLTGGYAGKILKGEKPADLPVVQSTKFEFLINLRAAKALGLDVPPSLSARADEVIE
ncbi:MAG: ABC transporter substrate-binding protein [Acidobacteria bacterium]|nr:MAG: ABC transporter substrate-binding protein [Acidobacteriota bacterium]